MVARKSVDALCVLTIPALPFDTTHLIVRLTRTPIYLAKNGQSLTAIDLSHPDSQAAKNTLL